jgi:subtilase family serine protease
MPKARNRTVTTGRFAAMTAAGTALIATALAVTALAPASQVRAAAPVRAARDATAALPRVVIKPGIIRLPGAPRSVPPTTAQCEAIQHIACYSPGQIRAAYHLPALYAKGIKGQNQTIVIVDSFGSPTIGSDLNHFDQQYGLAAPPKFTIIAPAGKIPAFDAGNSDMVNWAGETTLDVEYAHALAPAANILLVETPVSETEGTVGFPQIVKAEKYVIDNGLGTVISQSFSATEPTFASFAQLKPLRAAYVDAAAHHVTVLAASGDAGATDYESDAVNFYPRRVTAWPDSDPLVTGVGGTQLQLKNGAYTSVAWNDTYNAHWTGGTPTPTASGGGLSVFFTRPAWQNNVKLVTGTHRGVPDISMSAACDGAVNVYGSYENKNPLQPGWTLACGTSEATPEFAAIVALAAQVAGHRLGLINPLLYKLSAQHAPGLVDVVKGNNTVSFPQGQGTTETTVKGFNTRTGYDLVTGVGTINAPAFVAELAAG